MKYPLTCVIVALVVSLGVALADPVPADPTPPIVNELEQYLMKLRALENNGDWQAVIPVAQAWEKAQPGAPVEFPYVAEADAYYELGDIDAAIQAYQNILDKHLSKNPKISDRLATVRKIRVNFPTLKLEPLQFQVSDIALDRQPWFDKGAALLAAKDYDGLEKTASSLQQSKATDAGGNPYLASFFEGILRASSAGHSVLEESIAAWRKARPTSNLAHLAEVQMWSEVASDARGSGAASTITPSMAAKIETATAKAQQSLSTLPQTAFDSPLAFETVLEMGQIGGLSRSFLDNCSATAETKFPDYLPIYSTYIRFLLPRWYGEPGEAEALLKAHADKIGGEAGDIFYARVIWALNSAMGNLTNDSNFDYSRATHGLDLLSNKNPQSISVFTARLVLAYTHQDTLQVQALLISPNGHNLEKGWRYWRTPTLQDQFREFRMSILAISPLNVR